MLIYGKLGMPRLEIEGAALATTVARYLEFMVLFTILMLSFIMEKKFLKQVLSN